jgi:hypothetical protein
MKLSQIVEAAGPPRTIQQAIRHLIALDEPCWQLAGRLAVGLQRKGYQNAAKRVQLAATEESTKALGTVLQDLLRDRGIFPDGA